MIKHVRLGRELAKLATSDSKDICVFPKDDKLDVLEAQIVGPEKSPYQGGIFKLEVIVPDAYPIMPPSIKFLTKVYHPNIDDSGRICLDLIKMPPKGNWRPTIGIEALLIAVRMLLESPNPEDPLMADIAEEYQRNNSSFLRKAKDYTKKYACAVKQQR
ncbi:ubiquitin-conjugating enzyme E2 T [Dendroctonus ponderosae]